MIKKQLIGCLLILLALLSSCASYKDKVYFQGVNRAATADSKISNFPVTTIQVGDILSLNVKSLNSDGSAIFNTVETSSSGKDAGSSTAASPGYLVNSAGEIQLPLAHNLNVAGLTFSDAAAKIKSAITPFLKEPEVIVSLVNFRISVLGDVGHPDVFSFTGERFSIPQALSLAGDLTPTANRTNVLLVRETDGKRKFINIDLTSKDVFESPYYYLKNNDVIYVEPGKGKFAGQGGLLKVLPIVLSLASLVLISIQLSK